MVDAETVELLRQLKALDGVSASEAVRRGVALYAAERGVAGIQVASRVVKPEPRVTANEDTY